jgi:mannose-6-phosphate isomerase-like protein (cupin superfamily)
MTVIAQSSAKVWLCVPQVNAPTDAEKLAEQLTLPPDAPLARKVLAQTDHATIAAVAIRTAEPFHRHEKSDLLVILLRGKGEMTVGDRKLPMQSGDIVFIPKGVPHRFINTDATPSIGLALFAPPFQQGDTVPVQ